ncbi:hypothetical protein HU200_028809 [Digitaria exilis]|uniref:Protein MIZU-KUSSEI 1 n=1 Tax=Digitaria exilis TaxID=1010633 RepID=A0A835BS91_9POAL|nr:hypothetical protein HU200_028809 [Digitaria exilis]CAB3482286.1 unnamed protein product [Digitaria exilis]
MGFAIYPSPGQPTSDDARDRRDNLPSAVGATTSTSTSSSGEVHRPGQSLEMPSRRRHGGQSKPARLFQKLRQAFPSALTPRCGRLQVGTPAELAAAAAASSSSSSPASSSSSAPSVPKSGVSFTGASRRTCRRVTGTLYGHRRGRVVLALQETPRCLPTLVVELALQTHALLRELGNPAGARIVLETERRRSAIAAGEEKRGGTPPLLEEAAWTMFCNGKKTGYAVRREANDEDLTVMETLRAVSMGAGVLPAGMMATRRSSSSSSPAPAGDAAAGDDEVPYMRGCFDHFVGSKDSESLYMVVPQGGGTGPELAVFFVRL